jgi:hypothetical protein
MDEDTDRTTEAVQRAADAMREACHSAYHAPFRPGDIYTRLGALVELLSATRQIAQMTGELLDRTEQLDLGTDDGSDPVEHTAEARRLLGLAAMHVVDATSSVNDAWSQLSPVSLRS